MNWIERFGWYILGFCGCGVVVSIIMELLAKEPIYLVSMKAFSYLLALGGVLVGYGRKNNKRGGADAS